MTYSDHRGTKTYPFGHFSAVIRTPRRAQHTSWSASSHELSSSSSATNKPARDARMVRIPFGPGFSSGVQSPAPSRWRRTSTRVRQDGLIASHHFHHCVLYVLLFRGTISPSLAHRIQTATSSGRCSAGIGWRCCNSRQYSTTEANRATYQIFEVERAFDSNPVAKGRVPPPIGRRGHRHGEKRRVLVAQPCGRIANVRCARHGVGFHLFGVLSLRRGVLEWCRRRQRCCWLHGWRGRGRHVSRRCARGRGRRRRHRHGLGSGWWWRRRRQQWRRQNWRRAHLQSCWNGHRGRFARDWGLHIAVVRTRRVSGSCRHDRGLAAL